jgi:hypothetical protein
MPQPKFTAEKTTRDFVQQVVDALNPLIAHTEYQEGQIVYGGEGTFVIEVPLVSGTALFGERGEHWAVDTFGENGNYRGSTSLRVAVGDTPAAVANQIAHFLSLYINV